MRGDKRCGSFRKEKPAGLSRALSWLNVSSISRQSRRIFHSQNELHSAHNHQTRSHPHRYGPDRDEEEDEDNWVYQPQHKTGEVEPGKENQQRCPLQIIVYRHLHSSCRKTRPANRKTCLSWLNHSVIADLHWMDFCQEGSEWLFLCTCKARSGSPSFMVLHPLPHSLIILIWGCVRSLLDVSGVKGCFVCAIGKQCWTRWCYGSGDVTGSCSLGNRKYCSVKFWTYT